MKRADLIKYVGEPVRITWEDAVGDDGGWKTYDEAKALELSTIVTVGVLIQVSQRAVYVAMDVGDHEAVHGTGLIPNSWVQKIERLVPEIEPFRY